MRLLEQYYYQYSNELTKIKLKKCKIKKEVMKVWICIKKEK